MCILFFLSCPPFYGMKTRMLTLLATSTLDISWFDSAIICFLQDQSHCTDTGFNTLQNKDKPLVLKELKKLWEKQEPDLPWDLGVYNKSNTLLLDDSPYKALRNPVTSLFFFLFVSFLLSFFVFLSLFLVQHMTYTTFFRPYSLFSVFPLYRRVLLSSPIHTNTRMSKIIL